MTVVDDMLAYLGIATGLDKLSLGDLERAFYAAGGPPAGTGQGVTSIQGRTGIVTLDDIFASAAAVANKADVGHSHAESGVTNLVTDLAAKAASTHTHNETDVTNLSTDLSSKAATGHTHAESGVTNLVADLASKSNTGHSHGESEITSLVADLTGKSNTGHSHAESDVASLVADLTGKSNTGHSHTEADVASLSSDLSNKASTSHRTTHLPGGTDKLFDYGPAVNKPPPTGGTAPPDGFYYWETDTKLLWQLQAATWIQLTSGTDVNLAGVMIAGPVYNNSVVDLLALGITSTNEIDITGMGITVPTTTRPFDIIWNIPFIFAITSTAAIESQVNLDFFETDNSAGRVHQPGGFAAVNFTQGSTATSKNRHASAAITTHHAAADSNNTYNLRAILSAALPANWSTLKLNATAVANQAPAAVAITR